MFSLFFLALLLAPIFLYMSGVLSVSLTTLIAIIGLKIVSMIIFGYILAMATAVILIIHFTSKKTENKKITLEN